MSHGGDPCKDRETTLIRMGTHDFAIILLLQDQELLSHMLLDIIIDQ